MQNTLVLLFLTCLVSACQPSCPPVLEQEQDYEGDGVVVAQEAFRTAVVFYPTCLLNQAHYLSSLTPGNMGPGITVSLTNLRYVEAMIKTRRRFKLSQYSRDEYAYQGVYIVPAHIKFRDLQQDNPVTTYHMNYQTDQCTIKASYSRASVQLDTLVFLPYQP